MAAAAGCNSLWVGQSLIKSEVVDRPVLGHGREEFDHLAVQKQVQSMFCTSTLLSA